MAASIRPVLSPDGSPISFHSAASTVISKWLTLPGTGVRSFDGKREEAVLGTCLPVRLTWKALSVRTWSIGRQTRAVLQDVTGYAEPGKLTAIMGPSGSGKTTLLDALSGAKLATNMVQSGEIFVNGCPRMCGAGRLAAYVTQDAILLGTLSVRETLWYSASLRLPDSQSRHERHRLVEAAISGMGLQKCGDTVVGNWHLRGLSGGERKRLSIAVELLTNPPLLFLDEPTSGLDSAAAYFVTRKLQAMAAGGCTVISVMHQPSAEVFRLLDSVVLISGGRTIYLGDAAGANLHFAESGFPCPAKRNPVDHYLRIINQDFCTYAVEEEEDRCGDAGEPTTAPFVPSVTDILAEAYATSPAAALTNAKIQELNYNREEEILRQVRAMRSRASFWRQLRTLTARSSVNMVRDVGYYWLRLIIYSAICVCLGTLYFKLDKSYPSIEARGAIIFFVAGIVTFMAIASFPSFVEDIKVFYQERMNGHYGVGTYVLANTMSSLPMIIVLAVCSGSICYLLIGLHPGPSRFAYFVMNLCLCMLAVESLMMAVTSVVQSYSVGVTAATCVVGVFLLVAGFFRRPSDIPRPFWQIPVMYNAFHYYAIQGMMENEFVGLSFSLDSYKWDQVGELSGAGALRKMEVETGRGKWANLAIVMAMVVQYRLVFFLAIKLSERLPAWMRSMAAIAS